MNFNPKDVAYQLRDQLSSDKRKLGFFLGAGASMAVGVPGVFALTSQVSGKIPDALKSSFEVIKALAGTNNIEAILNKLRTARELIGNTNEELCGVQGEQQGKELDVAICKAISEIIGTIDAEKIDPHLDFANWLYQNQSSRHTPIELFTTNYDLLLEYALEEKRLPFFDGFVGAINPFLVPECIEAENAKGDTAFYIPSSWVRLWKLHGSINWFLRTDSESRRRIVRATERELQLGDELMIYPSKQKYDESRRLPFLVFQDRLRRFLSSGETLLVVAGYSFGDEHLNEVLFQALRANKRLAITALMYGAATDDGEKRKVEDQVLRFGADHPNFTVLGPDRACIGGVKGGWNISEPDLESLNWNDAAGNFSLGDFTSFAKFLKMHFGPVATLQEIQSSPAIAQ